jgi:hypothetical protein
MTEAKLKAPFPAFGGKSRVSDLVWERLGDPVNVIEPFANSAAFLLARPHPGKIETCNDANAFIANFWRAIKHDPEAVADFADWPVNEIDLHARHRFLVGIDRPEPIVPPRFAKHPLTAEAYRAGFRGETRSDAAAFQDRMRTDPEFHDPRIAGWWVWGACCWIGSGWCDTPESAEWNQLPKLYGYGSGCVPESKGLSANLPDISGHAGGSGRGVHQSSGPSQKRPNISGFHNEHGERTHLGRGVHSKVPDGIRIDPPMVPSAPYLEAPILGERRPHLSSMKPGYAGMGINAKVPRECRPQLADAFARGRGVNSNDSAETRAARRAWLMDWFGRLSDRLRTVRVCCGDWLRVCDSFSVTTRLGLTGVFLDAPYKAVLASGKKSRSGDLYANDKGQDLTKLVDDVIAYCVERGADPLMRLAACCYEGEGYEVLESLGWDCYAWKSGGGYGNRSGKPNENAERERIWFSPHCLRSEKDRMPLFDAIEGES